MQKIGFCDQYGLTQAVLTGIKTMTRRLENGLENLQDGNFSFNRATCEIYLYGENGTIIEKIRTRYKLGEVVAVAQSYKSIHNEMMYGDYGNSKYDTFRCASVSGTKGWSNKLFVKPNLMPYQIQMLDIRIERLQAIPNNECLKEGIILKTIGDFEIYAGYGFGNRIAKSLDETFSTPRAAFANLINRRGVGRKGLWEENPFTVVYEFRLVK